MLARLPLLTPEFRNGVDAFSRIFFQRLFDGLAPPVLVFDDCHEIDLGSSVHECLAEGMLQVPKGALIVVISRTAPPRQYARLRVNGVVEVIQPELLQLNATEASAIAAVRGAPSGLADIEAVLSRSHGWTAGFVLMLEALRTGAPLAIGDHGIVPELLFDYFASEVLRAMEPREQRLLMTLAVMPNMTAAAALSLTGDTSAGA
jgi:LuxR family transcriptional regulator, maltose regulon positive regulatory protein